MALRHILGHSESTYKYFGAEIRNFLDNRNILPNVPKYSSEYFYIYDNNGKRYNARLEEQNRIFCPEWYKEYNATTGDEVIIDIRNGRAIISPAEQTRASYSPQDQANKYDAEQEKIIKEIEREVRNKDNSWNKYKGDITAQIIIGYLKKYLPANLRIVGHDYFIHNHRKEYDAMIVKGDAQTYQNTNTYELKDVIAVIEMKESGFRSDEDVNALQSEFEKTKCKSLLVVARCAKKEPVRRIENAFILSGWGWTMQNCLGAWKGLVDFVKNLKP